jgi:transposase InsO family protein
MAHHQKEYAVKAMCELFGISRAAYYQWVQRATQPDPDRDHLVLVQEAYEQSRKTYGYRRITVWIRKHKGVCLNHKAVLRLMNKLNIRSVARQPKLYRKITTLETYHCYGNLLDRDFIAHKPNQKWVTDVTYLFTQQGWAYLSTIKDLFDGFIVAHHLGRKNSLALVLNTLQLANQNEKVTDGLILHSDQGHQYTSQAYFVLTQQYTITPSMSRRGNCWDNAPMETFFSHFKEEAWRHFKTPSFAQTQQIVDDYIAFYNYERIQLKTRQTPYETRCLSS